MDPKTNPFGSLDHGQWMASQAKRSDRACHEDESTADLGLFLRVKHPIIGPWSMSTWRAQLGKSPSSFDDILKISEDKWCIQLMIWWCLAIPCILLMVINQALGSSKGLECIEAHLRPFFKINGSRNARMDSTRWRSFVSDTRPQML